MPVTLPSPCAQAATLPVGPLPESSYAHRAIPAGQITWDNGARRVDQRSAHAAAGTHTTWSSSAAKDPVIRPVNEAFR